MTYNRHGLLGDDPSSDLHIIIRPRSSLGQVPTPLSIRNPCDITFISVVWVCKEFESCFISPVFLVFLNPQSRERAYVREGACEREGEEE